MVYAPILVAEDDENDLLLLQCAFKRAGVKLPLAFARNGEDVVEFFTSRNAHLNESVPIPRLLLLDLKMPKMGGFDTLLWIRKHPPLNRLVVVVMTSSSQYSDIRKAYDMHANSFVMKPSGIDEMAALLKSIHNYWFVWNESPDHFGRRPELL